MTIIYELVNDNGVISLYDAANDDSALLIMSASEMRAEKVNGLNADSEPVNFRVALRIIKTPLLFFLNFIDPTFLKLDGLNCLSAEIFMEWFAGAMVPNPALTAKIDVIADGTEVVNDVFVGRVVTAIIINDVTKNTGFTVVGNTLTFTDGTEVADGQVITVIF